MNIWFLASATWYDAINLELAKRRAADIEPIQFEITDEVIIYKEDSRLVLEPVARSLSLGEVLSQLAPLK